MSKKVEALAFDGWFDQFVKGLVEVQKMSYSSEQELHKRNAELHAQMDDDGVFDDVILELDSEQTL